MTDAVKNMIESKAVRSAAAVPYAEQLETDSEQSLFENQLSRSCTAVRTVDVGVMMSESSGSRTQSTHQGGGGVEISSFSSPHVNMSISNHSTTRKSWRSDAPIILPGWECHTGGSRSKPTVHRCRPKTGGCGLLTRTQDEPTKNNTI